MRKHTVLVMALLGLLASVALAKPPVAPPDMSGDALAAPYCGRNPFNRDTAEPFTIALTDWHGAECQPYEFARAGCPQNIREHAVPSNNPRFWGWWVGGGTAIGGSGPCENDGTWGWDYEGAPISKRIWLNWSHGHRYQGGTGAYKSDGPKVHLEHE